MLDIEKQFVSHAEELLRLVDGGRRAHATSNIAESGEPFERGFRKLFSDAIPETFNVVPGYFFNSSMDQSGQVDALFCDRSTMIQLPPTSGLEQRYVPYGAVRVIAQIKNGASGLAGALSQSASALSAWEKLHYGDLDFAPSSGCLGSPLSIVVIGREGSPDNVREALLNSPQPWPAYVLLLEQGILFGRDDAFRDASEVEDASFWTQGNGGPLAQLEPAGPENAKSGRLLMWLFFAVLFHLRPTPQNRAMEALIRRVQHAYPVKYSSRPAITLGRQTSDLRI